MLVRRILPLLLIALMLGALFVAALAAASALPVQDLAQYWAAAHLVTKNPYSLELTTSFERSAGVVSAAPPLVTKIPPSAIMLVLPLGFLGYKTAFALWAVMSIVVIAGCARAVWGLLHSDALVGSRAFVVAVWAYGCDSDARSAHSAGAVGHNAVLDPGRTQAGLVGGRVAFAGGCEAPRRVLIPARSFALDTLFQTVEDSRVWDRRLRGSQHCRRLRSIRTSMRSSWIERDWSSTRPSLIRISEERSMPLLGTIFWLFFRS